MTEEEEDVLFEQEKEQALKQDCIDGICECCEGSIYYELNTGNNQNNWK